MHANRAILLVVPMLASCGALMAPGPFRVPVDSEPSGATVVYAGKEVGVTPCVVAMQRHSTQFELRRDGCHPRIAEVGTRRNGWLAGNLTNLGLGLFVDLALGTELNLIDDPVLVTLASTDHAPLAAWVRVGPVTERPGGFSGEVTAAPNCSSQAASGLGQLIGGLIAGLFDHYIRR